LPALLVWFALLPGVADASAFERLFAPAAEFWERWQQHDASNRRQIDHATLSRFVEMYVKRSTDGMRRFAYAPVADKD
jgi:hypothetical protein